MKIIKFIVLLFCTITLNASLLSIDKKTDFYNILPISGIYIDNSKTLTIEEIQNKNIEFKSWDDPTISSSTL